MPYLARLVDPVLSTLVRDVQAVLIAGPRACGKTTSAARLAVDRLSLDRPSDADLARADPDVALRTRGEPLLIDEWQLVPEILGAVKRAVDVGGGARRFVVTGSAQEESAEAWWPLTGRAVRVGMWGLSEREICGDPTAASVLGRLAALGAAALPQVADPPDLADYVHRALRGGLPEAVLLDGPAARRRRMATYLDELLVRDVAAGGAARDPIRLRRYLQAWAANLAGVLEHAALYSAADINRATALAYDSALASRFVVDALPAWGSNRVGRLTSRPKRHLVEPALVGPLLGVDEGGVLRDPDLMGRLIESFVVAQLRPELSTLDYPPRLHHLRDRDGRHEVDVILEYPDGRVVGIEVKAAASATRSDARHLEWLRERIGERMICGVVLHTGRHTFPLTDTVVAAPIAALWS